MASTTTGEATEVATEVEVAEVDTRTRTIKVVRTKTKEEEAKEVTITTRDKEWLNQTQTCLNLHKQQDKLTNSKCSSSSQQHHKCR